MELPLQRAWRPWVSWRRCSINSRRLASTTARLLLVRSPRYQACKLARSISRSFPALTTGDCSEARVPSAPPIHTLTASAGLRRVRAHVDSVCWPPEACLELQTVAKLHFTWKPCGEYRPRLGRTDKA